MSEGMSLTFYGLFDVVDYVVIPILQRDYAQGRIEEAEVRNLFLRSLHDALLKEQTVSPQALDLDFVYGNYEEGDQKAFSVLDGQQRLTTLFLLHWFLAVKNDRLDDFQSRFVTADGRSRFTYKTRPSTTEFFNALTNKNFEFSESKNISDQMRDGQWFFLSWMNDPTVQACLNMLDAIQGMFSEHSSDMYEKLTDTDAPCITFQFLDLHSFGLSDELYIKMNARGKPLTVFENFKAKLEQIIQSFDAPWPQYRLPFSENVVDGYDYFVHKIDTDWADLFWPYRNVCSKDNTFDDEMMNLFRLVIAYQFILDNKESGSSSDEEKGAFFGFAGSLRQLTIGKYEQLNCFNKELIIRLINVFDLIYADGLDGHGIKAYLSDQYYYGEEDTFKKVLNNSATYDDKLRFFAFYEQVSKSKDLSELTDWVRVIYNLTENTIINTADEFFKALYAIEDLGKSGMPVLEALRSNQNITGFSGPQILEERIKAHLFLKSETWRDAIVKAERHPFFKGQIGCILNFSGILGYYRENECCDWDSGSDQNYLLSFNRYAESAGSVFSLILNSSAAVDYLWERAVLSKGVYFTDKSVNRFNLLSTRLTKNNIDRDHSWRRLLRIGSTDIERKQFYVKAVLDDPEFDLHDVDPSLQKICDKAVLDEGIEYWRRAFITYPDLFRCCNQGFVEIGDNEFILLSESQRNHYHSELYSKILEYELRQNMDGIYPLSFVEYEPVRSRDALAYVKISGRIPSGEYCSLNIVSDDGKYYSYFVCETDVGLPDRVIAALEKCQFQNYEKKFNGHEAYSCSSDIDKFSLHKIKDKLIELCTELRNISVE
ncbi:MAG: hypothetical protein CMK83_06375 [Pseudomonadales bacterium]|jgi:hypothetical protein|nr:hypothetical protein [Pseudomonadales bacterium]MBI26188.1 hypothetical protein [Pseudomonadales bacterium]|tara:strand:- start:88221 stop:90701 length:2481 start_codon:yes stop_codon:yes gene_type:complete